MTKEDFLNKVKSNSILVNHIDFIENNIRLAININRSDREYKISDSRLGGEPDLEENSEWPKHKFGPYRFLAQINLADIANLQHDFPKTGLLSFFVADLYEEFFWQNTDYIKVIYTSADKKLIRLKTPDNLVPENYQLTNFEKGIAIDFEASWDIPVDEYQVDNWPFNDEEEDAYLDFREEVRQGDFGHLLGYPSHNCLAYNPAPNNDFISLITLDSNEELEWEWHDGDFLMTFIDKNKLKLNDFSGIASDAG